MRQALTIGALIVCVALAVSSSAGSKIPGVARFRETGITHHVTGDTPGSIDVWRTRVWLLKRAQVIGTGVIACVRADAHTSVRECNGTYILPRGRIQVAGEVLTRVAYQLTIVGGTGVYIGSGGVAVFAGWPEVALVTFYLE